MAEIAYITHDSDAIQHVIMTSFEVVLHNDIDSHAVAHWAITKHLEKILRESCVAPFMALYECNTS